MLLALTAIQPVSIVASDQPAVLVLVDEDAIDNGQAPLFLSAEDVNDHIAAAGVRDSLPYFAANVGRQLTLPVGGPQDPGWFGLDVPQSWASADATGVENYLLAAPGLGSPDADGDRVSLLGGVPGVSALAAADLTALVGRDVCALVYDDDLGSGSGGTTNLAGPTLGLVAFHVQGVTAPDPEHPGVQVEVLNAATTCTGQVVPISGM
jgi:hypothetical protein